LLWRDRPGGGMRTGNLVSIEDRPAVVHRPGLFRRLTPTDRRVFDLSQKPAIRIALDAIARTRRVA